MTSTELMNVAAFENMLPDSSFASLNPADESLADGIGSSYGIVGYKGKVWTLRLRGETYTFTRPDDGSPAAFLDVIVLRSAPYKSKSYYAGGYQEGSSEAPACSSLDGVHPVSDARDPQCSACAICPKNEWKVNAEGRKGRDCADFKRLAVMILPSQTKPLLGEPLMEPVFLRVPAASLNDLAILGEAMQKKGFHYSSYITRIGFHVDKPHPQMTFKALQPLTAKEAPIVLPMREDPMAIRITGEQEVGKPQPGVAQLQPAAGKATTLQSAANTTTASQVSVKPAEGATTATKAASAASTVVTTAGTTTSPSEDDEEAMLLKQLAEAKARKAAAAKAKEAEAAKQTVIPPTEPTSVFTGFDDLGAKQPVVEVKQDVAVPGPNTADTGTVEESDTDLDAKVAMLLQR